MLNLDKAKERLCERFLPDFDIKLKRNDKGVTTVSFKDEDTKKIIKEIQRILKPNGYLFIRVNSTHSKEYQSILENNLEPIEQHLFFRKGMEKRFFDEDDIKNYFNDFEIIDMQEENMNRWSPDKIVWKCVFKNK